MACKALVDPVQNELSISIEKLHGLQGPVKIEKNKILKSKSIKNIKCLNRIAPLFKNFVLDHQDTIIYKLNLNQQIPDCQIIKEIPFIYVLSGSIEVILS